jgi:DNA repair exonuclease SbcCD nuclease subunit
MRFAHFADLHLGFHQYMLRQRRDDFTNTFFGAIENVLYREEVDFILISGDIFNSKKPSWHTISDFRFVVDWIEQYKVPLFVTTGNHCHTNGMTYVDYFDYANNNNIDGVSIHRVNWTSNPMSAIMNLPKVNNGAFNILMMHHGHVKHYGVMTDVDITKIKELGYDYIASGHIHVPYIEQGVFFNPGSLEYTSSDLWGNPGGYFVVDINDNGFTYKHVISHHRETGKFVLKLNEKVNNAKYLANKIIEKNWIVKDSLIEIIIIGNVEPAIISETETMVQLDSLRTKLKIAADNNIDKIDNMVYNNVHDVFEQVFGDKSTKARQVVDSSDNPDDVLAVL